MQRTTEERWSNLYLPMTNHMEGDLMKIGMRKPSLKKRVAARTSIKRQFVHRAGLKMPRGYGWLRNPKKYAYNKVYHRTTFDIFKLLKKLFK